MISALKRLMQAEGRLALAEPSAELMRDLQRRGLDRVFKLYESIDLAVADMEGRSR
jgi:hypothetical protein